MTSDFPQPRRHAVLAIGLMVALAGCGGSSASEAGREASARTAPSVDQNDVTAPLGGLAFEVHRDPG
jgi:hypothetical protein